MRVQLVFAIPLILGDMLQQCYNLADTLIVGQFLGENALAAAGSSFTLMTFITSILLGLCMGSGALFSIRFGERDIYGMKRAMCASFVLICAMAALLTALAYILSAVPSIGLVGIWGSVPIGWCVADITGFGYYYIRRKTIFSIREKTDSRREGSSGA